MYFFVRKSNKSSEGGMDGWWELLYGREKPWLMENRCVAFFASEALARTTCSILNERDVRP